MSTFAFRRSSDTRHAYFVLLHTVDAPDATIWSQYVEALSVAIAHSTTALNIFAVTDGGGPGPGQRRELAAAFSKDELGAMTHVFTTSVVTRGIVTAFHWLARARAVAHLPQVFPTVCEQCRIPAAAVRDDLLKLQAELPPVILLDTIDLAMHEAWRRCSTSFSHFSDRWASYRLTLRSRTRFVRRMTPRPAKGRGP